MRLFSSECARFTVKCSLFLLVEPYLLKSQISVYVIPTDFHRPITEEIISGSTKGHKSYIHGNGGCKERATESEHHEKHYSVRCFVWLEGCCWGICQKGAYILLAILPGSWDLDFNIRIWGDAIHPLTGT